MSTILAITPTAPTAARRGRRPLRALAGLLALAGAAPALAQVVHVDPPDIPIPINQYFHLDLNDDGVNDFMFIADGAGALRTAGYTVGWIDRPHFHADRLNPGDRIDIEAGWITALCNGDDCIFPTLFAPDVPDPRWTPGETGLLGVAFPDLGGLFHFGWIRLATAPAPDPTFILDWGYDATPFTTILAGDTGQPCPPQILAAPASVRAVTGDVIAFAVEADGRDLSYQWSFNGEALDDGPRVAGARSPVLTLSDVRGRDVGAYTVRVSSSCGQADPPSAKLDVDPDCPPFVGMALSNNGDAGFVLVPDDPALDLQRTATFEAWFRHAPGAPPARLLSKGDGYDANSDRAVDLTVFPGRGGGPGFFVAEFFLGPAHADRNRIAAVSDDLLIPDAWNHIAATLDVDAGLCRLYINGAPAGQTSVLEDGLTPIPPIDLRDSTYPLVIGAVPPFNYFNGRIDEVRVWNTARTPADVAAAFNAAVDPASPGLVAYYRFEHGPADSTGVHHGVLAGSAMMVWTHPCCPADFNRDEFVDFFDYLDFVACFDAAECPAGADADFNRDGFLDFFDYLDFVTAFETGCRELAHAAR